MKTLVIGSTCLDLIMNVSALPGLEGDVNTSSASISMGGMAYNVFFILKQLEMDAILGTPIGTGKFADLMMSFYKEKGIEPFAIIDDMDNGVCLCLVDKNGERTFISHHGAEYKFDKNWYKDVDFNEIERIYVGGLEVEEDTGEGIVQLLEEKGRPVLFAPGPRLQNIQKDRFERILNLHPILHINEIEGEMISGLSDYKEAANWIYERTKQAVIITIGSKGAYIKDNDVETLIGAQACQVVDTIGAGDAHAGAVLACLQKGMSLTEAVEFANKVSGMVVEHKGAGLDKQQIQKARELFG